MLTDEQDQQVEGLQSRALKCIFGPGLTNTQMREWSLGTTLRQRRIEAVTDLPQNASDPVFPTGSHSVRLAGPAKEAARNTWKNLADVTDLGIRLFSTFDDGWTAKLAKTMAKEIANIEIHDRLLLVHCPFFPFVFVFVFVRFFPT